MDIKSKFSLFFLIIFPINVYSTSEELTDEALKVYYSGDRAKALAVFSDIYANDNTHAESLYQLAVSEFSRNKENKKDFADKTRLAADHAFNSGNNHLGFYINAQAANKLGDPETALVEIEKALEVTPDSVRYLRAKMLFLIAVADRTHDYEILSEAIVVSEQALSAAEDDPKQYFTKGAIHFEIGRWLPPAGHKVHKRKIEHFKKAIELGGISETTISYAWNNMSSSLYQIGECEQARVAAEKALEIAAYGYAEDNLYNAHHCLADGNKFIIYWYEFKAYLKSLFNN